MRLLGYSLRARNIQHVPFEGLGSIEPWLKATGYEITSTQLFPSTKLPNLEEFDLLVEIGGPMSVNDEVAYPRLAQEKQFIRSAIEGCKSVLGVCLGAHRIARSLSARVYPNRHKEIGWFPVQRIPLSDAPLFQFSPVLEVFHWHGETFDLPRGLRTAVNCTRHSYPA